MGSSWRAGRYSGCFFRWAKGHEPKRARSLAWLTENIADAREAIRPLTDMLSDVPPWLWLALLAGGLLFVALKASASTRASTEAYRTGARR